MKLLEKVKNLFTEEYEEEVKPIKKEVMQVEIPAPVENLNIEPTSPKREMPIREAVQTTIPDAVIERREEKNSGPIFFDDKDFIELNKPKEKVTEQNKKDGYGVKKAEERKRFAPTPIISPVYGILDKNYHKEDIKNKTDFTHYGKTTSLSIDDVRNKAFGTLEDDLETGLFPASSTSILFNDEIETSSEENDFPRHSELEVTSLDDTAELTGLEMDMLSELTDEFEPINPDMTLEEIDNITRKKDNKKEHTLDDNELFDLIDSMYDKGDE